MALTTSDLIEGEALASACTIAGMMRHASLVFSDAREQKKLAPSRFFLERVSQRVCEMVDFPVPTIQYTLLLLSSEAQASKPASILTRVPSMQPRGSL